VGFARDNKDAALTVLSLLPQAAFMSPTKENSITATEAEFIKYAGNVYLARKVNLANVFAKAAEKLGANYDHIRIGMAADQRIGKSHLDVTHGGYRGFGGYCFPKDLDAFIHFAKAIGFEDGAQVLEADRKFNEDLLQSQGLTVAEVSVHKDALDKKFKS
jgi:UDPglucose 6-dehydrogenase